MNKWDRKLLNRIHGAKAELRKIKRELGVPRW